MDRSKTLSKSWDGNAGNWTKAVREGLIPSRKAGTDEAIVAAILGHKPGRLLDVGCGEGWLIRRVLQSADCAAVGIDGSKALIADAGKADPKSDYRVFGYDNLIDDPAPLGGGFDAIVFNYAILDEKASPLLAAIRPLLSANGRVFIQTLHPWTQDGDYRDGWRTEDFSAFDAPGWKPMPWYFRTLDSWLSEIGEAGLVLTDLTEPMAEGGDQPLSLILTCKTTPNPRNAMRNEKLDQILANAKPGIAMHWLLLRESRPAVFSQAATDRVDERIVAYFERLKSLPEPASKAAILDEIKSLFGELDNVNAETGGMLLETDERDLLVPPVIDAATVSGLDAAEFDDDPTLQFRNF